LGGSLLILAGVVFLRVYEGRFASQPTPELKGKAGVISMD
jgi:hypothetical protein